MAIYDINADLRDGRPDEAPRRQPRGISGLDFVLVLVCLTVMAAIFFAAISANG